VKEKITFIILINVVNIWNNSKYFTFLKFRMFPKIQRAALGWVVPLTWTMLILLRLGLLSWRKYNKREVGEGVIQQLGSAGNLHGNSPDDEHGVARNR
jgi:hypothetical protein